MRGIKGWVIPIIAILMIGTMQMYAMSRGHDGIVLVFCAALIAGIAGYKVGMSVSYKEAKLNPVVVKK